MSHRQIRLIAFITFILTVLQPVVNLPMLFQVSQVLAQTPATRKAEAERLFQQGIKQFQTSQFTAALQSWQQALIIYREIKDRQGEGQSLGNLGIAYNALGDYTKAIEYQSSRLAIAREIKDRLGEGNALGNLGNAYFLLGDYTKAIEYHTSHLAIAREIKDRLGEGNALGNLGLAYSSLGDYTKAIEYHTSSLAIAREIKDRLGEGQSLGNLGNAYSSLGDYTKAIEYHTSRLAIAREIKDRLGEGNALGNLGNAYFLLGDYTKAIEYHTSRLAIAREIKDRRGEGAALNNLGGAYDALGEYTKAIEYYTFSLVIAREIKDRRGEGQSLGNLGNAYFSLGDYTKAIEYHTSRLAIAREIKDRRGEGNALNNLGNAYYALGDYTKAIEYYSSSLAIAREIKDRKGEGNALGNLGSAYDALGDYTKAIEYYSSSLAILREIKDRRGESQSLNNLGNAYDALGDYTKAIEYHTSSLAIAREIKDIQGEGASLNNLGATFYKSGNLPQAETTLFTGIEVWESIRGKLGNNDSYKVSIFEEQARTYRILQKVLIAQNKTNAALEISERGRARAFVELLSSRLSNTNTSQTSQPAVDKPTISLLQKIAKQQNATLVQYSIITDDLKIDGKQQTKESELYIWVIKPTGEIAFRKSDLKPLWQKENTTLRELVDDSRESIGVKRRGGIVASLDPNAAPVKGRFQRLHELLITPIADLLPKKETERVVFIPQNELFLVPFPALQDEKGKYLIEKHTILTAPSIQILDLTHKQKLRQTTKSQPSLIVGNPTMPKVILEPGQPAQQLKALIWAEKEAKDIASLMNISALTGNKATKTAILEKMSQAGIIHFATHGLLDEYRGIGSAIALAPSGKDDGLLTADEILNLKLNADLVVLSACDTGRGRITGDGVVGLSRSLISAGTASIIVSLWAVDDDSTSFLMTEFYKNREQKLDKATALRKAMLTTKAKYSSPLNWAAFTLIGESE
ncbi:MULTISPECIES: tetratricopeptide repeat protein [unclassified Anabaena]|uniref:CHAT domain-containing protein n=1 Tax=unclassified Anabaena TaxID=2619674 RepID=UPI0006AC34B3|nr:MULTISPECIES: tetratricopeptide repeat protein [unclassified Anabaena]ALB41802.1 Fis family transcriptional regulator [Anabaena sp. WA102]OBQ22651.1 MAG: Fis family transcriptional regulator [Anabaena sp. AL93]